MAKKFSIVTIKNNEEEIFLRGFAEPEDLSNSKLFVANLSEFSTYDKVFVEIEHCLLLDFPGNDVDISVKELSILVEDFDDLVDGGYIYSEAVIHLEMYGIKDDIEYIE